MFRTLRHFCFGRLVQKANSVWKTLQNQELKVKNPSESVFEVFEKSQKFSV